MAHDPYSPCVCGSGKKLKFCCQDILPDMIRIEKLIDNQPDAAEKLLRTLLQKHTDKEVLVTQLAAVLTRHGQHQEARQQLVDFLQRHPDEPRVLLTLADVCLTTDGFEASRRLVHRAFQLGARQFPSGVAMLAARIAAQMAQFGRAMAVREHLALAVRMSPGDRRSSVLMQLANFESQRSVPYPFRGRFSLLPVELEDEALQKEEIRARKVSQIGCWEPAAILYSRLVEKQPDNGSLWHNLGLCRAWDGQIADAAVALHQAAERLSDFDTAAETEALAQLLEMEMATDGYSVVQHTVPVKSLSALLGKMDAEARLAMVESEDEERATEYVAEYELLTAALPDEPDPQNLPEVLADIAVVDGDGEGEGGPRLLVVCLDRDADTALSTILEIAGDHVAAAEAEAPITVSRMPTQCRLFDWKVHHPAGIGGRTMRELDGQRLQSALEKWLTVPQTALGDQSPEDAAKDSSNQVKVAASVLVLDVTCNRMGYDRDLSEIRRQLNLPEPQELQLTDDQSVTSLPLLQFSRLRAESLTDNQVIEFTNRATLVRHLELLERATAELIRRPAALQEFSPMRAYLLRANVARERNELHTASAMFAAARDAVGNEPDGFRVRLELDVRELSCRLDDPADPDLPKLLAAIRDRYFIKIPEIETVIRAELANSGCMHLLDELEPATAAAHSGLWTPGSDKPAGGAGKLYIPGQD